VSATKLSTTIEYDLANLPVEMEPLKRLPQWVLTKLIVAEDGKVNKQPFDPKNPSRHASTSDPSTWGDYATAVEAVRLGHGDGIAFAVTPDCGISCIDLDKARDPETGDIAAWAQNVLTRAEHTFVELSLSGRGFHVWGFGTGERLYRKLNLDPAKHGENSAIEVFRNCSKFMTITGVVFGTKPKPLDNIDALCEWAVEFGEDNRKPPDEASDDFKFNWNGGLKYSNEEIEKIVKHGAPDGEDRSALFHSIVWHYKAIGWTGKAITRHLRQYKDGIGAKYIYENRLPGEVHRSLKEWKRRNQELPTLESTEETPTEETATEHAPTEGIGDESAKAPEDASEEPQPEQEEAPAAGEKPRRRSRVGVIDQDDPDPFGDEDWDIEGLIRPRTVNLLSGPHSTGKTFLLGELAYCRGFGVPFAGRAVRPCGSVLLAYEGEGLIKDWVEALRQEKAGGAPIPLVWNQEPLPKLLAQDGKAPGELLAFCQDAHDKLMKKYNLPLGQILLDTTTKGAGFTRSGEGNDGAAATAIMNIAEGLAKRMNSSIFLTMHFGKAEERGTSGSANYENNGYTILYSKGSKGEGGLSNSRIWVEKVKGGPSQYAIPFDLRVVELPPKNDRKRTCCVVEWVERAARQQDTKPTKPVDRWYRPRDDGAAKTLEQAMLDTLKDHGEERKIEPDGPVVRMVKAEHVRSRFENLRPLDQGEVLDRKYRRVIAWALVEKLIGTQKDGSITWLWLVT
jgi:hypothetical protein